MQRMSLKFHKQITGFCDDKTYTSKCYAGKKDRSQLNQIKLQFVGKSGCVTRRKSLTTLWIRYMNELRISFESLGFLENFG